MTVRQLIEVLEVWEGDLPLIDKEGRAIKGARIVDDGKGHVKVVLSS